MNVLTRGPPRLLERSKRFARTSSLLVRVLAETARHAGSADIVRELVDGETAFDRAEVGDAAHWRRYVARIAEAAAAFPDPPADP